jgi:hypothetical protein
LEPALCGTPVVNHPAVFAEVIRIEHHLTNIMKPVPYIRINQRDSGRDNRARRNQQSGPLTDCFYQSSPNPSGSSAPISGDALRISKLRRFRKLSSDFFRAEAGHNYIAELAVFSLITGVSVWPIISMIVALHRMIK